MGVLMHWFKDIQVQTEEYPTCNLVNIIYVDGESTSHSYGNRVKLQNLFLDVCGTRIPTFDESTIGDGNHDIELIDPDVMVKYCDEILAGKECDVCDLRNRVEWIRGLSAQGYYISYEFD